MCTKYRSLFTALAAPFERGQVRQKQGYDYITSRTAMNRLDEVLGPENWWDDYTPLPNSVICRLTIRLPDGQVITKADAGGYAGLKDEGDDDKSGFADAFKRAAVKFGVFRYGYKDGVAKLVESSPATSSPVGTMVVISDPAPPPIPPPAPPAGRPGSEDAQGRGGKLVYGQAGAPRAIRAPKTGLELHYYASENTVDRGLAQWIVNSFSAQGWPEKIVDWTPDEVRQAMPSIREHIETVRQSQARMKASA
jgi:hypothetical protein